MVAIFKSYKKESRTDWGAQFLESENPNLDQIRTGAILRIADATEKLTQKYADLEQERDRYKEWYQGQCKYAAKLERRIAGLKGQITKMKKAQANP